MTTMKERQELWSKLAKNMDRWLKMSDTELLAETRVVWPMVASATRDEMLKFLVMDHTDKMTK